MAKWGFGRRTTARRDASTDEGAVAGTSGDAGEPAEGEPTWWLGQAEPSRVINRRWRSPRPGDLHPRRRSTDRPPPREPHAEPTAAFDPGALLRDQPPLTADDPAGGGAAPGPPQPWSVLDLGSEATWDEIVVRHRELAKQHHPDRAGGDPVAAAAAAERMAEINAAFAELGTIYRMTGDR